ncbi:hypothetical protein HB777_12880 [Mesorhizobium loti]|nr:hypothetical protein HB777_12880 [Mesorhizobium loti]
MGASKAEPSGQEDRKEHDEDMLWRPVCHHLFKLASKGGICKPWTLRLRDNEQASVADAVVSQFEI